MLTLLLIWAVGALVAIGMHIAYLKIIAPKRKQNEHDYEAYLWAYYTAGFLDRVNCRTRRGFSGKGTPDRITADGFKWYDDGYIAARDKSENMAEKWLKSATPRQKEVFYKILTVFRIADE